MKDFGFREVLGLMVKTAPFLVFRLLIYLGITVGFVVFAGVGAGIGYGIGSIAGQPGGGGLLGGLVGFGIAGGVLHLLREYLLYIVKAGHIAVLVEVSEGRGIPGGKAQITWAREKVQERFVQSTVLFGVDQLIKGILRAFNRAFLSIASFIPIPGLQKMVNILNTIVNLSLTYLDEVILAYLMKTRATNPWGASRTALILYAQNYKAFVKNAAWLAAFIWGLTALVFLLVLGPAALIVNLLPGTAGILPLILALVLAWGIKQAVIEPIGMTALMQVFFKVTAGKTPNPEWESKLNSVSSKFKELTDKARSWDEGQAPAPVAEA